MSKTLEFENECNEYNNDKYYHEYEERDYYTSDDDLLENLSKKKVKKIARKEIKKSKELKRIVRKEVEGSKVIKNLKVKYYNLEKEVSEIKKYVKNNKFNELIECDDKNQRRKLVNELQKEGDL